MRLCPEQKHDRKDLLRPTIARGSDIELEWRNGSQEVRKPDTGRTRVTYSTLCLAGNY